MSLSYILSFFHSQLFITPPIPQTSFQGQTVIVTGSNTGLGLDAARHITRLGAQKVILAVRNTAKGEAAKRSIETSLPSSKTIIEVWALDLTSYESVKQFSERAKGLERLDVLLENAGLMVPDFRVAEEDELTVTTNVTSTFLLGFLLLEKMRETGVRFNVVPRMVVVASDLHFIVKNLGKGEGAIFEGLNRKEGADMRKRYAVTKLMEILIVRELATRIDQSTKPKVIVNCLTPGACHSDFDREISGIDWLIFKVGKFLFARTTEVGSRTLVAAAGAGEESHGKYMADSKVSQDILPCGLRARNLGPALSQSKRRGTQVPLEQIIGHGDVMQMETAKERHNGRPMDVMATPMEPLGYADKGPLGSWLGPWPERIGMMASDDEVSLSLLK
ncbi:MAG: hypothetical protein Q9213_006185 [Squamulea squamosa]